MADSIRVVRSALVSTRFWTLAGIVCTALGAAWVQAVKVAMWVDSIPDREAFADAVHRIEELEHARDTAAYDAFAERARTTARLRAIAAAGAARARPKDSRAPAAAKARFDGLVEGGTEPIAALEIVLREWQR